MYACLEFSSVSFCTDPIYKTNYVFVRKLKSIKFHNIQFELLDLRFTQTQDAEEGKIEAKTLSFDSMMKKISSLSNTNSSLIGRSKKSQRPVRQTMVEVWFGINSKSIGCVLNAGTTLRRRNELIQYY